MFNNIDKNFEQISKKNNIKWEDIKKENKNSILQIGKLRGKPLFFKKMIAMANIDFEILIEHSQSDDDFSIEKYENQIINHDYTVWKEILLLHKIEKFYSSKNLNLIIHFYTSFVREYNNKPFMNFVFDYYHYTLKEFIYYNNILFIKHNLSITFQILLQGYYLDQMNIHHNDLHWNNIMIKDLTKKEFIEIPNSNKKFCVKKLFIIIDYGFVTIDNTKSNFDEFKNFFKKLPFFSLNIDKINSYQDLFSFIEKNKIFQ
jgi:hypothetical protein